MPSDDPLEMSDKNLAEINVAHEPVRSDRIGHGNKDRFDHDDFHDDIDRLDGRLHRDTVDEVGDKLGDGDGSPQDEPFTYSMEEVEAVYRKIDWRIVPAFWILYFLCSAVRSNIGIAQTMNKDVGHDMVTVLHLTSSDTATALTLFYVAYIVFDFPSNLIMSRSSPRVWMSRIVFVTGLLGACFTAVSGAWSLKLLRFLLGAFIAGMWPGMSYYLTLFYPPSRTGKRIAMYFSAAQISAAVVGLVSAGFQKMDGDRGLYGFQWMFLVYGVVTIAYSFVLLWWLPDRPIAPGEKRPRSKWTAYFPRTPEALTGRAAEIHYRDLRRVYHARHWTFRDLGRVLVDWRLWPLILMYFAVVGVGIGTQLYGSVIIASIRPGSSSITVSLLFAPIWIMDFLAILTVVPLSDRFHKHRALFFSAAVCVQMAGLLTTTFAVGHGWARYGGLLMVGFGLGPTVPICMTWTNELFQKRHGEVGVAAASALVSGLGNLGSVTTTYGLYTGWAADAAPGRHQFRKSNLVMVGLLCVSMVSSLVMVVLLRIFGHEAHHDLWEEGQRDGAAQREADQRGLPALPWTRR